MIEPFTRFGKWIVIRPAERYRKPKRGDTECQSLVRCDCGSIRTVRDTKLRGGGTTSCGCSRKTHGMSKAPEYSVWAQSIFSGSFQEFFAKYGKRPSDKHKFSVEDGWQLLAPAIDRIMEKVVISGECWEFVGANADGYGLLQVGGIREYTHRFMWMWENGQIPEGHEICHHCDNPPCVNPEHLFSGTHQVNILDARDKGRLVISHSRREVVLDGIKYPSIEGAARSIGRSTTFILAHAELGGLYRTSPSKYVKGGVT